MLAEVHPRDLAGDRLELAADSGGSVRLQVNHVLVRRSTRQEDHDHGLVRPASARGGLGREDLGHREPAKREAADPQESRAGRRRHNSPCGPVRESSTSSALLLGVNRDEHERGGSFRQLFNSLVTPPSLQKESPSLPH